MRTPRRLLALTPGTATRSSDLPALVRAIGRAFEGGLPAVLLREPGLPDRDLFELARTVVDLSRRPGAEAPWVGVHDSVHVALAAGADGVHLGFRSLPVEVAKPLVQGRCAVGLSAHEADDRERWSLADYLFFGPVRPTPSKEGLLEPTGFDGLARATSVCEAPVFALGGMRPEDATPVLRAGGAGLAVLSRLLAEEDPRAATRTFLAALDAAEEALPWLRRRSCASRAGSPSSRCSPAASTCTTATR